MGLFFSLVSLHSGIGIGIGMFTELYVYHQKMVHIIISALIEIMHHYLCEHMVLSSFSFLQMVEHHQSAVSVSQGFVQIHTYYQVQFHRLNWKHVPLLCEQSTFDSQ